MTFIPIYDFILRTFYRFTISILRRTIAIFSFNTRFGPAMRDALAAFEALFPHSPSEPAVAAAVMVLASNPPSQPLDHLSPALLAVAPHLTQDERAAWTACIAEPLRKAGIITARGLAAFLGQCSVESGGFRCLEEDLSYSAARLCQVWPTRFPTVETAEACALQPEALANRVYADRMGNGDEASGDGWLYRGRGLIQISGRTNYTHFAMAMNLPLADAVAHAATPAGAADSAIWFWTVNELNTLANAWSVDEITRKINGSMTGAAERSRLCEAALQAIGT